MVRGGRGVARGVIMLKPTKKNCGNFTFQLAKRMIKTMIRLLGAQAGLCLCFSQEIKSGILASRPI